MSERLKGREIKPEWIAKGIENRRTYEGENNPFYGKEHSQETKEKFNFFSEYLMDEPAIKKDRLLEAIDKYKKTPESIKYPLSVFFESAAKCFVPYNNE